MTDNITHERVTQLLLDVMEFTYNSDSLSEAEKKVLDDFRAALAEREPDAIARAVEAEREACAKLCEAEYEGYDWADREKDATEDCARAIRARGSK